MTEQKRQGGKRPGAGRPKAAPTVTIGFRLNKANYLVAKEKYGKKLNSMFNDFLSKINENN